jgi:tetratricopeptide (TPR) repeat protein
MRGVMARFYAAVRGPVERHGGTVEKVIGDALMAVFGIPAVHEDDALRALRAAIEMRDAVRELGEVEARIGVNTGDVLARDPADGESLVVGDAVNVAARLEHAAGPGEVLVGAATWALAGHAAHGERVGPIEAKGKREPLVAWRLESVDPTARGQRRRLDLPMVGRQAELGMLRWALDRAGSAQRPHLVTVVGQPGIGKSRLVAELIRVADGLTVLTGHCRATTESSSLEPLLEAVRGAIPPGVDAAEGVRRLMPGDEDAAAVAECLRPGAGAPDVAWAASRLVGALAASETVVIVFEDVHWASSLLLDLIEQLLGDSRRRALLVVCTTRPELTDRRPGWGTGANTVSVGLDPLDASETRRLLTYASPELADAQADRIVATAEGNPLFAEHLAALVGDAHAGGGLPPSLQVLLEARLEALPEPEREVVGVAAVVGRDFSEAAVAALLGRAVAGELETLTQRELVEPTSADQIRFGHALLQDAAYGLIPKGRRVELHVAMAGWLDGGGASDAEVGDHLERAYRLAAELGSDDVRTARLRDDAGARLAAAGRRADAMGDPRRATFLLERALDLLPEGAPGRAGVMVELAAAGWNVLGLDRVRALLADGLALAVEHGERAVELRARLLQFGVRSETGPDYIPEREVLTQTEVLLEELEGLDAPRAVATALCTRAESEWWLGQAGAAVASVRRAVEVLNEIGDDTVWALVILARTLVDAPMAASAGERLLTGLLAELGGRPAVRSELVRGQAMMALLRGRAAEAWKLFDAAREIDRDLGRAVEARVADLRRRLLLCEGRYEEALPELVSAVRRYDDAGYLPNAAEARSWLAFCEARLGNLAAAAVAARTTLEWMDPDDMYEPAARAHIALSEIAAATGDANGTVESAQSAVLAAEAGDWIILNAEARLTLAKALALSGDPVGAETHARAALDMHRAKEYAFGAAEAERFLRSLVVASA